MMKRVLTVAMCGMACMLLNGCSCEMNKKDKGSRTVNRKNNENKENNDIQTTASGLQYQILKEAPEGAQFPEKGKDVTVHYTGWLADANGQADTSKKFDSSVDRGMPFTFRLGAGMVIQGWDEGVALMKVGEKRLLIIPAKLGYGSRGAPGAIPGNATIIFEVELLKA